MAMLPGAATGSFYGRRPRPSLACTENKPASDGRQRGCCQFCNVGHLEIGQAASERPPPRLANLRSGLGGQQKDLPLQDILRVARNDLPTGGRHGGTDTAWHYFLS